MYKNTFSSNLKEMRKQKGMTQAKLAQLLNVSVMTVRRLEAGTRAPKLKTIEEIAKILEVDPMLLTFGDDAYKKTAGESIKKEGINWLTVDPAVIVKKADELNGLINISSEFDYKDSNEQIELKKDTIAKYDSMNEAGQNEANRYITYLSRQEEFKKAKLDKE